MMPTARAINTVIWCLGSDDSIKPLLSKLMRKNNVLSIGFFDHLGKYRTYRTIDSPCEDIRGELIFQFR